MKNIRYWLLKAFLIFSFTQKIQGDPDETEMIDLSATSNLWWERCTDNPRNKHIMTYIIEDTYLNRNPPEHTQEFLQKLAEQDYTLLDPFMQTQVRKTTKDKKQQTWLITILNKEIQLACLIDTKKILSEELERLAPVIDKMEKEISNIDDNLAYGNHKRKILLNKLSHLADLISTKRILSKELKDVEIEIRLKKLNQNQ